MSLHIGQTISQRYVIDALIGEGAFGYVYRAHDRVLSQHVALKISRVKQPLYIPMWREAALLRRLQLPGVARLLDEGKTTEGFFYFVMEFAPGTAARSRTRSWPTVSLMIYAILEVFARVHDYGFVHGDIKPSNVFWHETQCTVLDFGLARGQAFQADDPTDMLLGTLAYASPEQLRGEPLTAASDVYGLGVLFFELLTGRLPHPTGSFAQLARARLTQPAVSLTGLVEDDVDVQITHVIKRMMAREVEDRYKNAGEVFRALSVLDGTGQGGLDKRIESLLETLSHTQDHTSMISWFAGPDTLHHLAEDAALELWRRTGGDEVSIQNELQAWLSAKLAVWDDTRLVVDRRSLRRLATGIRLRFETKQAVPTALLASPTGEILAWLELLWPEANEETIRQLVVLDDDAWANAIDLLVEAGCIHHHEGNIRTHCARVVEAIWSSQDRLNGHDRLVQAIELGTPARSLHLLMGSTSRVQIESLCQEAIALDALGHVEDAVHLLEEGTRLLQVLEESSALEVLILETWSKIALTTSKPKTLEHVLFVIENSAVRDQLQAIELLLASARLSCLSKSDVAFAQLDNMAPFEDTAFELRRHQYRAQASWTKPLDELAPIVTKIVSWARSKDQPEVLATALGWEAMLAYKQMNFEYAAQLHHQASKNKSRKTGQLSSMLNGASALVDAFEFERALTIAREGQILARSIRHAFYEGRALFIERACIYRQCEESQARLDFVEAVARLDMAQFEGIVSLYEAAIAWRGQDLVQAQALAQRAQVCWSKFGNEWGAQLANALKFTAMGTAPEFSASELWTQLDACPLPRIACQIAGLLSANLEQDVARFDQLALKLSPETPRHLRLEVLSIDEARQAVLMPDRLNQTN